MLVSGLNQMTMPNASAMAVLETAAALGCVGVELRNDLSGDMFDGQAATAFGQQARAMGQRILGLAEVYGFNSGADDILDQVRDLAEMANDCGAEAIILIPEVLTAPIDRSTQRDLLLTALAKLQPVLEDLNTVALIEPLGFANASLRFKADVQQVLDMLGNPACFGMVHDTFHHTLAGEDEYFPEATKVVHISGVAHADMPCVDADRGLVDADDQLGTLTQIKDLQALGYSGPFSTEAFAPSVHTLTDPQQALSDQIAFITSHLPHTAATGDGVTAFA